MTKLKKQKTKNLINYQQFLKNNYLKNKNFKSNNILFNNQILYKNRNLESYVIEFNEYKNIYLPTTLIKISEISTISKKYEDVILFNYDLTYNIICQFNRIIFQSTLNRRNNLIKGRLVHGNWNNKKIFISVLGIVFPIKPFNLNSVFNRKKKNYYNKYKKKNNYHKNRINLNRIVNSYKLRYLNFKINSLNLGKKKKRFSRLDYVQLIIENKKIKKKILKRK